MYMVILCRQSATKWSRTSCIERVYTAYTSRRACLRPGAAGTNYRSSPKTFLRGVKSRATLHVQDLPQGVIVNKLPTELKEDDAPTYPTVVQQAKNNMQKFDNCVLLTRVGGFYEVLTSTREGT